MTTELLLCKVILLMLHVTVHGSGLEAILVVLDNTGEGKAPGQFREAKEGEVAPDC